MVVSILHRGRESPEVLWRRNLRADSLRLGAELHGRDARRPGFDALRIAAGIIRPDQARHFRRVEEYASLRAELPKSFRNGVMLASGPPFTQITNLTTGTAYSKICDAVYLANPGDEIVLPAGCGALDTSMAFSRYSHFTQLDSFIGGYTNSSNVMVIGNPFQASTSATYLSIVGIPSINNLSSVSWSSTGGGQLSAPISGSPITTYRRGMYVRISGATNSGTGGAAAINSTFPIGSVSGSTLVLTAPASAGVFGTIGGSPVLNNDRAQVSAPIGYLAATLNPGDTTIQLDDASDFNPSGGGPVIPWGNGDGTWQNIGMAYTGISGNTLTGVTGSGSLPSAVPAGNPIVGIVAGAKALITPASTDPTGITMSNLELWGAAAYPSGAAIFGWNAEIGQAYGSTTFNNVFVHDCMMGIRPGASSIGLGVFTEFFNSELWRCGLYFGNENHNAYVDCDIVMFYNSLSWQSLGVHLFKSRARTNYFMYSRTYRDWGTLPNAGGIWSTNYDVPNGGLTYFIGCLMEQSENDDTSIIRYGDENDYPQGGIGNVVTQQFRGSPNPVEDVFIVNCTVVGPSNGTGQSGSFANNGALTIGYPGLGNPEIPLVTPVSGGSLPARSYWIATTLLDSSGNEGLPSCMTGTEANPFSGVLITGQTSIGANQVASIPSPVARTGAVQYNVWAAHADPAFWWNSGNAIPPATGANQFFYDSAFTLPVSVVNAGGSQPAAFVYVGITYVFSEGESVNYAVAGADLRFPSGSPLQVNAALIAVPSGSLLTIKSPPAVAGATGWYPYVNIEGGWNSSGSYLLYQAPLSKQVWTPIAIGTDWVQSGPFIQAETFQYNFYKQNASPIAMGTGWTEPTTGLTNLNPNLLKWYRHGDNAGDGYTFAKWFAVSTFSATNYVVNAYNDIQYGNYDPVQMTAILHVWSGATTPWPFDADYPVATLTNGTSATATTAASNTAILAAFRTSTTAGSGWTQLAALSDVMSEYQVVSSPQSSLAVTQSGGSSTQIFVEALAQKSGGTLALRGSPQTFDGSSDAMQWTVPSISVGDVLIIDVDVGSGRILKYVDPRAWGPPSQNEAINAAPGGIVINNLGVYYNPTGAGTGKTPSGGWLQSFPTNPDLVMGGHPTISATNLQVNTFNGTGFDSPLVAAVCSDVPNFDFRLISGSPAINAGTNPGSGDGNSLVPVFQTSMIGPPAPGFPIAALTTRSDSGNNLGAFQFGASAPNLRLKWMRFGWDWKTVVTLGAAVIVKNPVMSRRNMLLLQDGATSGEAAPPPGPTSKGSACE